MYVILSLMNIHKCVGRETVTKKPTDTAREEGIVFNQPLHHKKDETYSQIFKLSTTGLNSVFLLLD